MGGEVMSPFETMLMRQPPPMPPEPSVIVNMAPVTMAPPQVTVNNMMDQKESQITRRILTPVYDADGKIVSVESKVVEMVE
jgi:hypothetical protein